MVCQYRDNPTYQLNGNKLMLPLFPVTRQYSYIGSSFIPSHPFRISHYTRHSCAVSHSGRLKQEELGASIRIVVDLLWGISLAGLNIQLPTDKIPVQNDLTDFIHHQCVALIGLGGMG